MTPRRDYRIVAHNSGGSSECVISIEVVDEPPKFDPTGFVRAPVTYVRGMHAPRNAPVMRLGGWTQRVQGADGRFVEREIVTQQVRRRRRRR